MTPFPMFGRRRRRGMGMYGGGGGCLSIFVVIALVFIILMVMSIAAPQTPGGGQVTRSTVTREPLPSGSVNETGYYTDELGWIGNRTALTAGMRSFYQRTGVQPHLYIAGSIYGLTNPTDDDAERFADEKYEALFSDEAHLLVIFFEPEPDRYQTWYRGGRQAKSVLDDEAMDILLDYIDLYYYAQDMTDEQFFSKAFDDASKRIMEVTTSPWIPVLMIGGVIILALMLFNWWNKAKAQKNLEAEQTREILNTPLEKFGGDGTDDLAKKYEN